MINSKFIAVIVMLACALSLRALDIPAQSVSAQRTAYLEKLTADIAKKSKGKMELAALSDAVCKAAIAEKPSLKGNGAAVLDEFDSEKRALKKLNDEMDRLYPVYEVSQLDAKAEELFPLYKRGARVTIVYRFNPRSVKQVTGNYQGVLPNGAVQLNNGTRVLLRDMAGLAVNEGPKGEIAKLDPKTNAALRSAWKQEYHANVAINRKKFIEKNRSAYIAEQIKQDFLANEDNGYTYWNEIWYNLNDLVNEIASAQLDGVRRGEKQIETRREENRKASILNQGAILKEHKGFVSETTELHPLVDIQIQLEEAKKKELLEAKKAEEARIAAEKKAEEERLAAEATKEREEEEKQRDNGNASSEQVKKGLFGTSFDAGPIFIALVAIVVLVTGGIIWRKRSKKNEDELDVSKFFEGKGQLQKEFWAAADADPENFRYVTYLFDNMSAAKGALQKLSFIFMTPDGKLQCRRKDLQFGCYEHQGRAVAFIGGTTLNYARWREASMCWPELPGASYFKVSVEPQVKLDMSSVEELTHDDSLHIVALGQEDRQLSTGEIKRMFLYSCSDAENARKFLDKFTISDDGVVVQVTLDDGSVISKDIDHIFEGLIEDLYTEANGANATGADA